MAREVRVLAEPDFPKTIFVKIQTNDMSADWDFLYGCAQTHEKSPIKTKNLHIRNLIAA